MELGQPKAAAKTARYALTLEPAHVLCHVLAGFLSQERRGYAEAREHYERALALEPVGPFARELKSVLEELPLPAAPASDLEDVQHGAGARGALTRRGRTPLSWPCSFALMAAELPVQLSPSTSLRTGSVEAW